LKAKAEEALAIGRYKGIKVSLVDGGVDG